MKRQPFNPSSQYITFATLVYELSGGAITMLPAEARRDEIFIGSNVQGGVEFEEIEVLPIY